MEEMSKKLGKIAFWCRTRYLRDVRPPLVKEKMPEVYPVV
jgi:hypothetical protein